ncbi:MAG: glycoside hydrolase family 26 protein [Bacteroidales bacterium]
MKKQIKRISIFLITTGAGAALFLLLTLIGKGSRGPFESLFSSLNTGIVSIEKQILNIQQKRMNTMASFVSVRDKIEWLRSPDSTLIGVYDDQTAETYEPVIQLEDTLKTKFPLIQIYTAWGSKRDQVFPFLRVQAIYDLGSIPMVTWEPWLNDFDGEKYGWVKDNSDPNKGGLKAIVKGEFDNYIDNWAGAAARFSHPVFLRFGHEMNDPYRYPWGPQNNDPKDFIDAWRHIRDRFKAAGANNVVWVWSPHPGYLDFDHYYPGNEYVDWIGLTALNYGTVATWSRWWSFKEIINESYTILSEYGKPIMICELGSLNVGGDRAQWFGDALSLIKNKYTAVKSLLFFHVGSDITVTYKSLDWSFKNDSLVTSEIKKNLKAIDFINKFN